MTRLDRYLARSILVMTLIVGLGLMAIFTFTSYVAEISSTGRGDYGLWALFLYTLLNLPFGLQTLLPIIALLGTLMGLGNLASQNEMTAMRSAGISELRIGYACLLAGLLLGAFGWVLGDWLAPQGRQAAERLKTEARYGVDAGASLKPVWLREGRNIVHIQRLVTEHHVEDVTIYTIDDALRLRAATHLREAHFRDGAWRLQDVARTEFDNGGARPLHFDRLDWDEGLDPGLLRLFVLEAQSLTVRGLLELIQYLQQNGLDVRRERLALWRKLVAPATVIAMMLFAVPFAYNAPRKGGAGLRLMVGVLIGVSFYVVNEVSASYGQLFGWHPAVSAGLPTVLLAAIALARLYRGA